MITPQMRHTRVYGDWRGLRTAPIYTFVGSRLGELDGLALLGSKILEPLRGKANGRAEMTF